MLQSRWKKKNKQLKKNFKNMELERGGSLVAHWWLTG